MRKVAPSFQGGQRKGKKLGKRLLEAFLLVFTTIAKYLRLGYLYEANYLSILKDRSQNYDSSSVLTPIATAHHGRYHPSVGVGAAGRNYVIRLEENSKGRFQLALLTIIF